MNPDRPPSAGFSRHIIQATTKGTTQTPTPPPASTGGRSSYAPPTKKLSSSPTPPTSTPHFERQPPPTIGSYTPPTTMGGGGGGSPFIFSSAASGTNPSTLSTSNNNWNQPSTHGVRMPRDSPLLPRGSPTSTRPAPSSLVMATSGDPTDIHAAEQAMLDDIGLFKDRSRTHVTVESLLKEKREGERLAKARAKDMATINSILPTPQEKSPAPPSASTAQSQAALDMSLITSLTQRLSTLEKIASKQAKSLGMKDVLISDLQSKLKAQEHSQDAALLYSLQKDLQSSRNESEALRKQLAEMETFLNDYGLVWVGFRAGPAAASSPSASGEDESKERDESTMTTTEGEPSVSTDAPTTSPAPPSSALPPEIFFDVPAFLSSVTELNSIATEGNSMRIHTTSTGVTKFLPPVSLDLVLYKDGMFFRSGPLRSWSLKEAREFIKDITEGYFPYELKDEYPDGVCLAVIDRSKLTYADARGGLMMGGASPSPPNFLAFAGKGQRLEDGKLIEGSLSPTISSSGGSPGLTSSATTGTSVPIHNLASGPPITQGVESFLSKLPTHVVTNGKVVEVRGEIGKMLGQGGTSNRQQANGSPVPASNGATVPSPSPSPSTILVPTPALKLIQSRESASAADRMMLAPLPPIATLQVKMDPSDTSSPLLLKLTHETTVQQVREYVDSHRKDHNNQYELRTTYPARNYPSDDVRTLVEAGLTPNANLFVRNKRPISGYRNRQPVQQPKPDESWSTPAKEGEE